MPTFGDLLHSRVSIGLLFVMTVLIGMISWWNRAATHARTEDLAARNNTLTYELNRIKEHTIRRFRSASINDRSIDGTQLSMMADAVFADRPTRKTGARIWNTIRAVHPDAKLTTYYFHITDCDEIRDVTTPLDFYVVSSEHELIGVGQEQPIAGSSESNPFAVVYKAGEWDLQILNSNAQ